MIEQLNATTYGFKMPCGDLVKVSDNATELNRWGGECKAGLIIPVEGATQLRIPTDKIIEFEGKDSLLQYHEKTGEDYELGGFAVDQIIFKKPKSNVLSAPFSLHNIKASYQPPLTQEDIEIGCERPEKVVGSYALYHATRSPIHTSKEMAEKYKACKVGMWYKQLCWDNATPRNYSWAQISLDTKTWLRTTVLNKEFHETATYPITIDDDFGYTDIGGSTVGIEDEIRGTRAAPTSDGTGTSISAYLSSVDFGDYFQFALYTSASPSTFLKGTDEDFWGDNNAWNELDFTGGDPSLSNGVDYEIVAWADKSVTAYYDDESGWTAVWHGETYNSWPASITFGTYSNRRNSIYCTYTPSGEGWTNIASVMDVGQADIASFKGPAKADIASIKGAAV